MGNVTSDQVLPTMGDISLSPFTTPPTTTLLPEVTKILRGLPSNLGEFPYQVFFEAVRQNETKHCSGSILTSVLILTAAHCVVDSTPEEWNVYAGLTKIEDRRHEQVKGVAKIWTHPDYNIGRRWANDIAILVLSSPLKFNQYVETISIYNEPERVNFGTVATVAGWGATLVANMSRNLLKVNVTMTACIGRDQFDILPKTMICAGDEKYDACEGDSGAALTVNTTTGERVVVGIVSYGQACKLAERRPGVYTNVAEFQEFIQSIMERHNTSKCGYNSFYCIGEDKCIPLLKFCDGVIDCADWADELEENGCEPCPTDHFRCPFSPDCLPKTARCDGVLDCPLGEDEANCTHCSNNLFRCLNSKKCIPKEELCDGEINCPLMEDESACTTCTMNRHRCQNSTICLPRDNVCDGVTQCPNSDDELNCRTCVDGSFRCPGSTKCIPSDKRCDGVIDCPHARDEIGCKACSNPSLYRCRETMTCINVTRKCDGFVDCPSGDDEEGCEWCTNGRLRCIGLPECIEKEQRCDGNLDCSDGQDEVGCSTCPDGRFRCPGTPICIHGKRVCDNVDDCPKGEDEGDCHLSVRVNRLPGQIPFQIVTPKDVNVQEGANRLRSTLAPVIDNFPQIWDKVTEKPKEFLENFERNTQKTWDQVTEKPKEIVQNVGRQVSKTWGSVKSWFGG